MNNLNSGYSGYSMSNRAVEAYEDGEKPLNKWLKKDIIASIEDCIEDNEIDVDFDRRLNKVPVRILKNVFLCMTSWHHTSSFCNETSFYLIDIEEVEKISNEYLIQLASRSKEVPEIHQEERWICCFLEWSETKKRPKATEITEEGII